MHHTAVLLAALAASVTASWKVDIQPFNQPDCPANGKAVKTQYLKPGDDQCKTFNDKHSFTGFTVVKGTDDFDHMMKEQYCTVSAYAIEKCQGVAVQEFLIENPNSLDKCQQLKPDVLGRSMRVICKKRPCNVCQPTTTVYATQPNVTEAPGTTIVIRPSMSLWTSTSVVPVTTTNSLMIDNTVVTVVPSSSVFTTAVVVPSSSVVHSWVVSSDVSTGESTATLTGSATGFVTSMLGSTTTQSVSAVVATVVTPVPVSSTTSSASVVTSTVTVAPVFTSTGKTSTSTMTSTTTIVQ